MAILARLAAAILALAFLSCPVAAPAAERVLSGNHDTFARLVFRDREGLNWAVEDRAASATVTFKPILPDLDLQGIFRRIDRTRLRDVRQAGNALVLDLNCACGVDIFRIRSGHIVIDIQDPDPAAREASYPTLPLVLPQRPMEISLPAAPAGPIAAPKLSADLPLGQQVRRYSGTMQKPLPPDLPSSDPIDACPFEARARAHFLADPSEALGRLAAARRSVIDDAGAVDRTAVAALADLYLDIGWGWEALSVAAELSPPSPAMALIAAAMDGEGLPPDATMPQPSCGPASAVVAALLGADAAALRRVDGKVLAGIVADMTADRRATLLPRLRTALERAEASAAMAFLPVPEALQDPSFSHELAGTGESSLPAVIASLNIENGSPQREHIINAMAFRPSLPPGSQRDELDVALALALMRSGYVAAAVPLAREGVVTPERLLDVALDNLSAGQVLEAGMRLGDMADPNSPVLRAVVSRLRGYGLHDVADRLGISGSRDRGEPQIVPFDPEAPVARSAPSSAEPAEIDLSDERRVIEDLKSRRPDTTASDAGDLARATDALTRAREMRRAVRAMVAPPQS
jgi:hypothetical protein